MAGGTLTAKAFMVHIIILVAFDTFLSCLCKLRRQMALLAGDDGMQPNQREARHVMLEPDLLCPAFLVMTAATLFSLFAGMHIIHTMTVNTAGAELFIGRITAVTGRTGYVLVTTP